MKKSILIIVLLVFIFQLAACTENEIESNELENIISETIVSHAPKSTNTEEIAPELKDTNTITPTPTHELTLEHIPTKTMLKEYDVYMSSLQAEVFKKTDVSDYEKDGNILHVDNAYKYSIEISQEWFEQSKINQYGYDGYAYQKFIIDFDGYRKFDNEITIISSDTKRDPRELDDTPDEIIKSFSGNYIEIYYVVNNSSKIEFNFFSDSYSHFYGNVKMEKSFYKDNDKEIINFMKSIGDFNSEIKEGYSEYIDEKNSVTLIYPTYWQDIYRIGNANILFRFGDSTENENNSVDISFSNSNYLHYAEEESDLILKSYEGKDIKVFISSIVDWAENEYIFYLPDYDVRLSVWTMDDIFTIHREEIMTIVKSIKGYPGRKLELIEAQISDETKINCVDERSKVKFSYPNEWTDNIYYGLENDYEKVIILFNTDSTLRKDNIKINGFNHKNPEYVDMNEIDDSQTITTHNGTKLYLTQAYEESNSIIMSYNIGEKKNYHIWLSFDSEYYADHLEEINEFLISIEVD